MNPLTWQNPEQLFVAQVLKKIFYNSVAELRVSMNPTLTHKGSHDNLLGKNPSKESEALYSNELQVKADTPPAFIIHSSNDEAVPVANSINYYMELIKNKIPASLHTYPIGGHGWGFHDSFPYKRQWTEELEQWLKEEIQ